MIKDLAAPMGNRMENDRLGAFARKSMPSIFAGRRAGTLLLYTMTTLAVAIFCSFVFNALQLDTEFAIAVMGSLIGGFLGALLAAALIVDIYLPRIKQEFRETD